MSWAALDTYLFSGIANTSTIPAPTSYASPSTGQAWTDVQTGRYAISSGLLVGTTDTVDASQYKRDFLIAGSATDEVSGRIVATTSTDQLQSMNCVLRYQRSGNVGNCYLAGYNASSNSFGIYVVTGSSGSLSATALRTGSTYPATGHQYTVDFTAVGTNPTVLTATITDITASGSLTLTVNDSTSNLQAAGALGIDITNAQGAATAQTDKFTQLQTFSYVTPVPVNLPQANIYFPPQAWDQATSGHAICNASGNYLKANFTNSATDVFSLVVNTAVYGATADGEKPYLKWSIDSGALQQAQLTAANTPGGIFQLSSSLAAGTHTLQVWVRGSSPFINHWNPAADRNFVDITGFEMASGTLAFNPVTTLPNNVLILGDSIPEGEGTETYVSSASHAGYATNDDATHAWPTHVANALNAECSIAAFGGQGWLASAADGVTPGLATTYQYLYSGIMRSFAAITHVLFCEGTNGNTIGSTGTVSAFLTNLRAALTAASSSAKIIGFIPLNGSARAALIADFTTYQGAISSVTVDGATIYKGTTDANAVLIDLGTPLPGLSYPATTNSAGSLYSYDTVHPSTWGHERVAAMKVKAIQAAFAPSGSASIHATGARGGLR